MRVPKVEYLAEHLVMPRSLEKLYTEGGILRTAGNRKIPVVDGVPVFSTLHPSPQWQDELRQTSGFADSFLENPNYARSIWTRPWLNDDLLSGSSRTVCIGGSYVDDVPHISKGHKFNVDLWAHHYSKLPPAVMAKQDTVFLAAHAEALPFDNQSVDYVYSRNALDHFNNPILSVVEAHRILKENGRFCLAVYYDSSWFDAHETKIVDRQFLEHVILPLFEQEHLSFAKATPTGPVLKNIRTRFMFYVGTKRTGATLLLPTEAIERYELIGTSFQKALYEREHHRGEEAMRLYQQVLSVPPVCDTDACRQLHACIDLLAMTDKDALLHAAGQMHAAGIAVEWAPIADLTLGRYGLSTTEIPTAQLSVGSRFSTAPFEAWKWPVTLARCAELLQSFEAAVKLRELGMISSPSKAKEWLGSPVLPKSKRD
jgi:SAM-dependent methyltransferase